MTQRTIHLAGPAPVGGAKLVVTGHSHKYGTVAATLPNGERCEGQFNTVANHITWDDERPFTVDSEDSEVGVLVLSSPSGYALRCDFSENVEGTGNGECHDGRGQKYAMVQ